MTDAKWAVIEPLLPAPPRLDGDGHRAAISKVIGAFGPRIDACVVKRRRHTRDVDFDMRVVKAHRPKRIEHRRRISG